MPTLFGSAAAEARASLEDGNVPLTSTVLLKFFGGRSTSSGVDVTPGKAAGLTPVWRATSLLAGLVAGSPRRIVSEDDGQAVDSLRGTERLVDEPHRLWTAFEWYELLMAHALLWGNSYHFKVKDGAGRIAGLLPIEPSRVEVHWTDSGRRVESADRGVQRLYKVRLNDEEVGWTDEQVLHVPGFGFDGLRGAPVIEVMAEAVGGALAAEKYASSFFGNGTLQSGFLTTDRKLTKPQADALKQRWQDRVAGIENAHEVAVLDAGATFQTLSIPPETAQLLETRQFNVEEVARMFGVPPHLLMQTTKVSSFGAGIEQQNIGLTLFTLELWTKRIAARLTKELMRGTNRVMFDTTRLLKGDSRARFASYLTARKAGLLTINEIRRKEGEPPLDDERANDPFAPVSTGSGDPGDNEGEEPPPGDGEGTDERLRRIEDAIGLSTA